MEILQVIVFGLWSNEISRLFSITILILFFFSLILINKSQSFPRIGSFVQITPNILSSLGILGTFVGIFIGLLDFDIRTINRSVPGLLEGLKVAFGTSILGLSTAILFRILKPFLSTRGESEDATIEDIITAVRELTSTVQDNQRIAKDGFEQLNKSLSDDGDSSVTGQLQRLRSSLVDLEKATKHGFDAQIVEFKAFAEHMSKTFSDAIIEELKSVIHEFNEKISTQFGDNFKQLNEAVGRLLEWQNNYKDQMDVLINSLNLAAESVDKSRDALDHIEKASASIPEHMEKLSQANALLIEQIEQLHDGIQSVHQMRERAEGAIPEISAHIDEMTAALSKSGEQLTTTINQLDEQMQEEIGRVMQAMAENLSGIAEQFVKDYTPILEETRKIVEIGRAAKS